MANKQQKDYEKQTVISPLANEKTYGERWYTRVVDWGFNYWTNLFASAAFSQWVEHGTRRIKLPFMEPASPREIQQNIAQWFAKSVFMKNMAAEDVAKRSMSRARAITLLMPGFLVMIPAVWLGAKIKPWFVEKLNRSHYGEEAMDDPSLQARHQAIRSEERPTFLGTFLARIGTVFAVQATSQIFGSENNILNKAAKKANISSLENFGIDPAAKKVASVLGEAIPSNFQQRANRFAKQLGIDWSHEQVVKEGMSGPYTKASQDMLMYLSLDTIYTLVTALTIRPLVNLLKHLPFMSYKPKGAPDSAVFDSDGNRIKAPANRYADMTPEASIPANEEASEKSAPDTRVTQVQSQSKVAASHEQKLA